MNPKFAPYLEAGSAASSPKSFLQRIWHKPLSGAEQFCQIYSPEKTPTILLLHGLNTSHATFRPVALRLAKHFRVLTPDMRLHGKTPGTDGFVTLANAAEDIRALLDHLKVEKFYLVGHSHGARLALKVAALLRNRVEGLALEDMSMKSVKPEATFHTLRENIEVSEKFHALKKHYTNRPALIDHLKKIFPETLALRFGKSMGEENKDGSIDLGNVAEHKLLDFLFKWEDLTEELEKYSGPLTLLRANPKYSRHCDEAAVAHMRAHARDFHLISFKKSGHTIHRECPAAYAGALRKTFLPKTVWWRFWAK